MLDIILLIAVLFLVWDVISINSYYGEQCRQLHQKIKILESHIEESN